MATENITIHYPEMHGDSEAKIQAEFLSFSGRYRVKSVSQIEIKRGIEFDGTIPHINGQGFSNKKGGWFTYYMTEKAFKKFSSTNKVVLNCLLD